MVTIDEYIVCQGNVAITQAHKVSSMSTNVLTQWKILLTHHKNIRYILNNIKTFFYQKFHLEDWQEYMKWVKYLLLMKPMWVTLLQYFWYCIISLWFLEFSSLCLRYTCSSKLSTFYISVLNIVIIVILNSLFDHFKIYAISRCLLCVFSLCLFLTFIMTHVFLLLLKARHDILGNKNWGK